ncbi:fibrobacter succinogenes major paralogous domain-containing protein [Flavobacterium sp.]|uniref:fibrobacter succinogenes major paralogous domain-containing protein n=1 Tax=Flavobacterium sp. TaxID=239 RepID=UPI0026156651|nr:fibrobacter succinogenes major paralogous domain-containing protein [Flavobacterium sp.]
MVQIGTQIWMTKNLNVSKYRNGDPIPQITDMTQWRYATTGAWCYYNNDPANGAKYGKLYNWYAVNDSRGLTPEGWHIPNDDEWNVLNTFLGGSSIAGGKMKEVGTTHWLSPNSGATNINGFTALPGGSRGIWGEFQYIREKGCWWSTSTFGTVNTYRWELVYQYQFFNKYIGNRSTGFSVRCIKD